MDAPCRPNDVFHLDRVGPLLQSLFVSALFLTLKFNKLSLVFSFPLIWIAFEHFRSTFLGGFSWYLLAHSQHDYPYIIQISDLFGAYGVSFLVASVNGFLTESLHCLKTKPSKLKRFMYCY